MNPQAGPNKQEPVLSPQEIQEAFSMLGLNKEEERQKFCIMAEAQRTDEDYSRIWFSGTTAVLEEETGGANA